MSDLKPMPNNSILDFWFKSHTKDDMVREFNHCTEQYKSLQAELTKLRDENAVVCERLKTIANDYIVELSEAINALKMQEACSVIYSDRFSAKVQSRNLQTKIDYIKHTLEALAKHKKDV